MIKSTTFSPVLMESYLLVETSTSQKMANQQKSSLPLNISLSTFWRRTKIPIIILFGEPVRGSGVLQEFWETIWVSSLDVQTVGMLTPKVANFLQQKSFFDPYLKIAMKFIINGRFWHEKSKLLKIENQDFFPEMFF